MNKILIGILLIIVGLGLFIWVIKSPEHKDDPLMSDFNAVLGGIMFIVGGIFMIVDGMND